MLTNGLSQATHKDFGFAAKKREHGFATAVVGQVADTARRDPGSLATIGRKAAVAQLGRLQMWGFPAWLLWAVAHVYFLIGTRNRLVVSLNWAWSYVTFERGARLITGATNEDPLA